MKQTLVINSNLTDLNTYISQFNRNRYIANNTKQDDTMEVYWACKEQAIKPVKKKVRLEFIWYVKNRRKDPDNISSFARKALLDGMVKAGVLKDDGLDEIDSFSDKFIIDTEEQITIDIIDV